MQKAGGGKLYSTVIPAALAACMFLTAFLLGIAG